LFLETDGAMLHTREKAEDGSPWKENKLGMAFSSAHIIWYKNKKGEMEHQLRKREYSTYLGGANEFKKHMFALALRNGYGHHKYTVLISDGATWIRNMRDEFFPDAQQILDYSHLCENISKFAKSVFSQDEPKLYNWTNKVCDLFKNSKTNEAIDMIKNLKINGRCTKDSLFLLGYIENNRNNIDYAFYKSKGWFIGSGAIESGNKSVLQQRLKQPGMRWSTNNGQEQIKKFPLG
jgi:hypothetical protein